MLLAMNLLRLLMHEHGHDLDGPVVCTIHGLAGFIIDSSMPAPNDGIIAHAGTSAHRRNQCG
jgi:hypothetical protein